MAKQQQSSGITSLLGQGSSFEGAARLEGTLRVDGTYDGSVEVGETLVIGKPGAFRGDVQARDVIVCGRLQGTITASGSVELQAGCRFEGDLRTRTLIVEEGVFFQGNCRMDDGEQGGHAGAEREGTAAEQKERRPERLEPAGVGLSSNGDTVP
jgi:cytoskeletal protein CcmA (bactofilin family)